MKFKHLLLALFVFAIPFTAEAKCGRKLSTDSVDELTTFSGAPASGDYIPICDTSANVMKKIDASSITLGGAFNGTVGATTPSTGVFTSIGATLAVTDTRAPTADSATTNNAFTTAFTTPVDTTGTNTHNGFNVSPTIGNASGGTNTFNGFNFGNVTGDAQVDVTGLRIGTGTTLGTSNGIVIGSGWDAGITNASKMISTYAAGVDSAATNIASSYALAFPADTTGTNTHEAIDIAITAANATGGTNTVNGINFPNYTGDAQVNINAIKIGTSDGLGTAKALSIGTGWDNGIDIGSPVTGSGLTTVSNMVGFTRAIQTQQTTLTAAMCGSIVTNSGAVVSTLPEASTVLGCQFTFVTGNASNFDVNPFDGTDQISLLTNAAGDAIRNATVGNSVTLVAVSNDAWHQVSIIGTWSDVN